jgi:hypothetical protein
MLVWRLLARMCDWLFGWFDGQLLFEAHVFWEQGRSALTFLLSSEVDKLWLVNILSSVVDMFLLSVLAIEDN